MPIARNISQALTVVWEHGSSPFAVGDLRAAGVQRECWNAAALPRREVRQGCTGKADITIRSCVCSCVRYIVILNMTRLIRTINVM